MKCVPKRKLFDNLVYISTALCVRSEKPTAKTEHNRERRSSGLDLFSSTRASVMFGADRPFGGDVANKVTENNLSMIG